MTVAAVAVIAAIVSLVAAVYSWRCADAALALAATARQELKRTERISRPLRVVSMEQPEGDDAA